MVTIFIVFIFVIKLIVIKNPPIQKKISTAKYAAGDKVIIPGVVTIF
jgi:hypothetical protein